MNAWDELPSWAIHDVDVCCVGCGGWSSTEVHGPDCELATLFTAEAELAALKARRCDGCQWWSCEPGAPWGFCEAFNDCATKPDHACNAWTAKEPTT